MIVNTLVDLVEKENIDTLLLPLSWWDMGSDNLPKYQFQYVTLSPEFLENN